MRKIMILLAVAGLFTRTALNAQQDFNVHEFSVSGGGGLSSLKYSTTAGEQKNGAGGQFGLGYRYFFSPEWGLGTGVEIALYNSKYSSGSSPVGVRYTARDLEEAVDFEFRSSVSGYDEKQRTAFLQIPLMLQYQTGAIPQFYIAAGVKVGIPLSGKYESSGATVRNSGYYPVENYEYTTQEFMGFGTFAGKGYSGDLKFKTAVFASVEAGVKWKLNDGGLSLYSGAYFDCGLNSIRKSGAKQFVEYNGLSPVDFSVNSIAVSQHGQTNSYQPFTEKITPIAFGVKFALAFGTGTKTGTKMKAETKTRMKAETRAETKVETKPETKPKAEAKPKAEVAANKNTRTPPAQVNPAAETASNPISKTVAETASNSAVVDAARQAALKEESERLAREKEAQRVAEEQTRHEAARQETARREAEAVRVQAVKTAVAKPVGDYKISQTEPTDAHKKYLDEKIALLLQNPEMKFYIYGHTCDIGTVAANTKIGLGRAQKAKEYMLFKNISVVRILGVSSKRDTEPVVPNTSEENRRQNRRVEIVIND